MIQGTMYVSRVFCMDMGHLYDQAGYIWQPASDLLAKGCEIVREMAILPPPGR